MAAKDRGPSGGKGWRGGGESRPAGARTPGKQRADWTKKVDRDYEGAVRRHRARVAVWSALLVALIVGFVVWLFWTPRRTPFLIASVTDYEAPIPPNGFVVEDIAHIQELEKEEILFCHPISWPSKEQGMRHLREQLEKAVPRRKLVVIYLSMHGVVDEQNEPCLLPPGASPIDSRNWLRVSELLDYLFKSDRPNRQPDNIRKLLILDSNRMDVNWNLGLLYNSFADRLKVVVDQANVRNLVVLNSTGPGQIGWTAPELKGSIFGLFLWQGLKGAANVYPWGNGDREVSLQELHKYLTDHVGQWVTETRVDVQTQGPMLIPEHAEFPLVFAKSDEGTRLRKAERDERWKLVHALWDEHARLKRNIPYRLNPVGWAEFEDKLMRLEQLVQAGRAYEAEFSETRKELEALAHTLNRDPTGGNLAAYSLPLASQLRQRPTTEQLQLAELKLNEALAAKPAAGEPEPEPEDKESPEETTEETTEENPDAETEPEKEPEDASAEKAEESNGPEETPAADIDVEQPVVYPAAAQVAWHWLLNRAIRDDPRRVRVFEFVDASQGCPRANVIELHFARMLDAHLDPLVWQAGANYVKRALLARNLAAAAAAPDDERAFYWIQKSVDLADAKLRRAEDMLFIGPTGADLGMADQLLRDVSGGDGRGGTYQDAVLRAGQVARAFELRDRAWAEVPYLAQWQLARLHESDNAREELRAVIDGTQQLAVLLDEALPGGQWTEQLRRAVADLNESLEGLENAFYDEYNELGEAGEDPQTLKALTTVLSVPLVTGRERYELREKQLRILRKITSSGAAFGAAGADKSPKPTGQQKQLEEPARQYLDRLKPWWDEHPAIAILSRAKLAEQRAPGSRAERHGSVTTPEPDDTSSESSYPKQRANLAGQGGEVRRLLASASSEAQSYLAATEKILKSEEKPRKSATREGYSRADRLVRAAAPLLGDRPWTDWEIDPAHLLRALDLHYLLLWRAEHALTDFWGPKPGTRTPYFEIVANDYLKSARELCEIDTGLRDGKVATLLKTRTAAAQQCIRPLDTPGKGPETIFIDELEGPAPHGFSVAVSAGLPEGRAALYLRGRAEKQLLPLLDPASQPPTELRRMNLPVSGESAVSDTPPYLVPVSDLPQSQLQAVALYRGHLRTAGFSVQPAEGWEVEWLRPDYPPPTIVVYGQARQRNSIVFIFDCSGSMGNPVLGERDPRGQHPTRLDVARGALETLLQRLLPPPGRAAAENPYSIGLRIYGHRVGWDAQDTDRMVVWNAQRARFMPKPPDLNIHPSEDVELILSPGRFTQAEFSYVRRRLESLHQLGETPLYLAITQAIDDLSAATVQLGDKRHIIAITDGANWQSTGGDVNKRKVRRDVEKALGRSGNNDIRLDIVGFSIKAEYVEEFRQLANHTGGKFFPARDPSSLLAALEKLLGMSQYKVLTIPDERSVTFSPLPLNVTCTKIDKPTDRPVPYLVRLTDEQRPAETEVVLEGAEAIELYLEQDLRLGKRQLVHHRYDKGLLANCDNIPAVWEGGNHALFIGAHLPDWDGRAARFFISVQNADAKQFCPRPKEVWIRVKPVLPATHQQADTLYTFYDAVYYDEEFLPERPVPMLTCLAPNWPKEAKDAKIEFACKYVETQPDATVTVRSLRQQPPRIDDLPNVRFNIETKRGETSRKPYQVTITEHHTGGSEPGTLKIEILPPVGSPSAQRIVRRYIPKTGRIRHTFFFDDSAAQMIDDYKVLFTTRDKLLRGAVALPEPLDVTLTRD